ncbi:hypothetical protein YWS52_25880 [Chitiniphilus shinanonensis]
MQGLLLNEQFRSLTEALPNLIKYVLDDNLFAYETDTRNVNFMEMLIQHQIGTDKRAADGMLDRFTEDLAALAGSDGLGGQVWSDVTDGRNGLLKLILENYYNQRDQTFDHLALKKVPGGVSLDLEEISGGKAITALKGHKELKAGLLNNISVGIHHNAAVDAIKGKLDDAQVWTLGAAQGRSLAFDGDERNDLVDATDSNGAQINGGGGNDILIGSKTGRSVLSGGDGDDILLAGQGGSTLDGGAGNDIFFAYNDDQDTLTGGEGKDIYYVSGGDTIIETGRDTEIYYGANKIRLTGGKVVKGMKDTWQSADGLFRWVRTGPDTFMVTGPEGTVIIKDESQTLTGSGGGTGSGSGSGGDSGSGSSGGTGGDSGSGGDPGSNPGGSDSGGSGSSGSGSDANKTEKANPAGIALPGSDDDDPPGADPVIPTGGEDAKKAPPPRRDPLTLDLDHDGLETVGAGEAGSVLFDHRADGVKTSTGWVKPDDGLLVLDRNRNGKIDNGRELFGDATLKSDGTLAKDGFDALADLDSNQDGKVDAADSAFANLRVWRDLNANGISDAGELFTLQQLGIAGFNVARTSNDEVLDNGNRIADLGTYYHADGSVDQMGTTGQMADIDLAEDTYRREFTDPIAIPEALRNLPDLQGSGRVRDLLQAAALSPALAQALSQFVATESRAEQQAQLQHLLNLWADTADFKTSREQAAEVGGTVLFQFGDDAPTKVNGQWQYSANGEAWLRRLDTFESFWGQSFVSFAAGANNGATTIQLTTQSSETVTLVTLNVSQLNILKRTYDAFAASVYEALASQIRYQPYLDAIKLVVEEHDFHFDTSGLTALVEQRLANNPVDALLDLIGLARENEQALKVAGLEPWPWMEGYLGDPRYAAAATQALSQMPGGSNWSGDSLGNFALGRMGNDTLQGNGGDDVIRGLGGNDTLYGGIGDDLLDGGAGDDTLDGGVGNDRLYGAIGNDLLKGGNGNDTYRFNLGDGLDRIEEPSTDGGGIDVLEFGAGIELSALRFSRLGKDLIVHYSDTDSVRIGWWYNSANYRVEQVRFADGTQVNLADQVLAVGVDQTAGNDSFSSSGEAVYLRGGLGDDTLSGNNQVDRLEGGAGNDTLSGYDGADLLIGGEGNDVLIGGNGDDIYRFNLGDGQDRIEEPSTTGSGMDVLEFGAGIELSALRFSRLGNDLIVHYSDTDSVRIGWWYNSANYRVEQARFADGTQVNLADQVLAVGVDQTAGNDSFSSSGEAVYLRGGLGDDTLSGNNQVDRLEGGAGNDTLSGYDGADLLIGGEGNDVLIGGNGDDIYRFSLGDGQDRIEEPSTTGSGTDVLEFGAGIELSALRFSRLVNDLIVHYSDTDSVRIGWWYNSANYRVEQVRFADGTQVNLADQVLAVGVDQTAGNDSFSSSGEAVYLRGGLGDDTLSGASQVDRLEGGAGNDTLSGYDGADLLIGGEGNDVLIGGNGDDIYRFSLGDGQDRIEEPSTNGSGTDVLEFGAGIELGALRFSRLSNDLIVHYSDTDSVRIGWWYNSANYRVEQVRFADGTQVNLADQVLAVGVDLTAGSDSFSAGSEAVHVRGGLGDDTLTGNNQMDRLEGGAGNDTLSGYDGADLLIGGEGNDVLKGGNGDDIYRFNLGDGQDRIEEPSTTGSGTADVLEFGAGIELGALRFSRLSNDLIVHYSDTDSVRISGWYNSANYRVEQVRFTNGALVNLAEQVLAVGVDQTAGNDIFSAGNEAVYLRGGLGDDTLTGNNQMDRLEGGAGNDTLSGYDGADLLIGGEGNDVLKGGNGDDIYRFNLGDGQDRIEEPSTTGGGTADVLEFGAGIELGALRFSRLSNDLIVHYSDTDNVRISGWYNSANYRVEQVRFADGTQVSLADQVLAVGVDLTAGNDVFSAGNEAVYLRGGLGDDTLTGNNQADRLEGGEGNDTLSGNSGADLLIGGAGNDTLQGGTGNDTYQFAAGFGQDRIVENDAATGNTDLAQFSDAASDQLWFRRVGSDLEVSVIGTGDKVTVASWYSGKQYHVEQFKTADGKLLLDGQVDALVSAMAGFAPPDAGQTTLPDQYREQLQPVLAANWH